MILGVHISGEKNLPDALAMAQELGCNTMQVFARSPPEVAAGFYQTGRNRGI